MKNLFGFEYLIAPYTIAHLKLSQYLRDQNHPLNNDERLQVYLTNTLEPVAPQKHLLLPAVTAEVEAAQTVKESPILVITGNPPYSGHSKNKGPWITAQIAKYREGFPELSKPAQGKWLQDDYVKFIRFAQMKMDGGEYEYVNDRGNVESIKMEGIDRGVVAIITNHSYLDNPTFKGMRKSLMATFNQIYILDLHGNAKKKERAPDGSEDQNVFDIEQGVAISIFIKKRDLERNIWHSELWGKRLAKYQAAAQNTMPTIAWTRIEPGAPDWLFIPQDAERGRQYREFWNVPAIFAAIGDPAPGFLTTQDEFAISFTRGEAAQKIAKFLAAPNEREARLLFRLCSQDQWSFHRAKSELPHVNLDQSIVEVTYRPFDDRWTVWNRNVAVHRRERVNKHLFDENIALLTTRITKDEASFFVSSRPAAHKSSSTYDISYLFPLYLNDGVYREALSAEFRAFIDAFYDHHYTPEEIFGYIYAVLYAPTYRTRYAEFLRIDFPHIPFPETRVSFEALSKLGWALVQAHLLRELPRRGLAGYFGKGDHTVEAVRYSPEEEAVWINKTQCFKPVPQAVWDFYIGGYQVLEKYLKSRKGRVLSLDEINHVAAIADSLAFTIDQMTQIDKAYRDAFPDRG